MLQLFRLLIRGSRNPGSQHKPFMEPVKIGIHSRGETIGPLSPKITFHSLLGSPLWNQFLCFEDLRQGDGYGFATVSALSGGLSQLSLLSQSQPCHAAGFE